MLSLGFTAARKKAGYPIAFNAANEQVVAAFLRNQIRFVHLAEITARVMQEDWSAAPKDITEVMLIDESARRRADEAVQKLQFLDSFLRCRCDV